MNDLRQSDPNLDLSLPSRRTSASSQGTGQRHQDGSKRNSSSARLSNYEEHARALKQQLSVTKKQLKAHEQRSADTEQRLLALATQLKLVHDERILAIQEAAKANEELKLYKIQLEHAHKEIRRAQQIIDQVDEERYQAEKEAAEARTMARRYRRDMLMMKAMEEGRRLGLQEGIEQGRALALLQDVGDYDDVASDYLKRSESQEYRPPSLLLPPKEEIKVHPPEPTRLPTPPSPPPSEPPLSEPIPIPPPEPVQPIPESTPRPFRSPSPSIHHPHVIIPPDGYIPVLDADNIIRMPPPHELARPPPTPERAPSPQLPDGPDLVQEESRPNSRSQHRRRLSTSSFASTSSFNGVGPSGKQPLSAIPEVQSPYTSPLPQNPEAHVLRHQPSQASTRHSNAIDPVGGRISPQPSISISRRPSVSSNLSRPPRPPSAQEDRRQSTTSSSAPGITIVPPSRPLSGATARSQRIVLDDPITTEGDAPDPSVPTSIVSQLFGTRRIGDSQDPFGAASPRSSPNVVPAPMPGDYQEPILQTPMRQQPSPVPSYRSRLNDDAMSIRSGATLTTPQVGRRNHNRRTSLDSSATGWEDAVRSAGSPVPVPHHVLSSRPASRSTNRG
ncbi:hypothetical protein H0H92_007723 [Tricholoma furcatifolium]|nr:hypothetical protein H0H92_007723 [Tricholoma furcatifolium]